MDSGGADAAEPRADIAPDLVLQRFAVKNDGDYLLVPVKIRGKDRLFLMDTGSTVTVVDRSLPLGFPRGVATLIAYDPPDASIGGVPLGVDVVVGMDLNRIREVSGHRIEGVLGMDFLGRHVVHIDFDRGELLLLRSAPGDAAQVLPLVHEPGEIPEIEAWLTAEKKVRFLIDTGNGGGGSGCLEVLDARSQARSGEFREVGSTFVETASGTITARQFLGKRIILGGYRVEGPVFRETPGSASLGLGFWSRFVVTFDFPGRKVHLRKGRRYERPDWWDRSGLHLIRRGEGVVVEGVDRGSPGEAAGIRTGDALLGLDGSRAEDTSLLQLRAALSGDGPRTCVVRRGQEVLRLTVRLSR
jgi:hypothetical protein